MEGDAGLSKGVASKIVNLFQEETLPDESLLLELVLSSF